MVFGRNLGGAPLHGSLSAPEHNNPWTYRISRTLVKNDEMQATPSAWANPEE